MAREWALMYFFLLYYHPHRYRGSLEHIVLKHLGTGTCFCKDIYHISSRPLKSVNNWNQSAFWNAVSHEFRCRWRRLAFKLRPEIDIRNTFTLIKTVMRFKQIIIDIYRFWCQNGAIFLLPFWLNNQSQIFPEKHSL